MRADLSFASPQLEFEFFKLQTDSNSRLETQVGRQLPDMSTRHWYHRHKH